MSKLFEQRTKKVFMDNQKKFYELMFWELMLGVVGIIHNNTAYIFLATFAGFRFGLYVAWQLFVYMIQNWVGEDAKDQTKAQ